MPPILEENQECSRCGGPLMEPDGYCLSCGCVTTGATNLFDAGPTLPFEPRTRFGDYDVIEEIARGGMGVVYKARQRRLNRTVALKVMLPGVISNRAQIQRFNAEAQIVAGLNHPNIISVHEISEEGGACFFSMPLINGVDLSRIGRIDPEKAARYLQKIAEAVYHAHQRGVLHRDLKPNNVLIDEHDEPRVVDFGISKLTAENQSITEKGDSLGTPSYMAPEQVHPDGNPISVATDIYGLGGVLYFLLTGRPPFAGASRDQTLWAVFYDEPVKPTQIFRAIPRDLETICLKCLAKDPADRYATAGDLAADLRCYVNHQPISARPISLPRRTWLWARRNPALAVCASALIFSLIYGAVAQQLALAQARKARAEAENLIEYMDKELSEKLRPLGRLDLTADALKKAEAYFNGQNEANSGPSFLLRKASYFWHAGNLQRDLGNLDAAKRLATNGFATLARFQSHNGQDPEGWSLRAGLEFLLFRLDNSLAKKIEARDYAARALADQRRALSLAPHDRRALAALSEILMETGRFYRTEQQAQTADAFLQEAAELLSAASALHPNDLELRRLLAITHYDRGLAQQMIHDNASALREFKLFIQGLESIAHLAGADRHWQHELAIAYARAAEAYYSLGALDTCEPLIVKWRNSAEQLSASDPNNVLWRASLAQSLAWSGLVARDKAEADPRVPELFERAVKIYKDLSLLVPNADGYAERVEEISANLVRYYKATEEVGRAEELLRSNIIHQFDLALRAPDQFGPQKHLARSFQSLVELLENQQRSAEAASFCQLWIGQLRSRFADAPAPFLWHWGEARVNGLLANLATHAGKYDRAVVHWRCALDLLQTLPSSTSGMDVAEEISFAYRSLASVHSKRQNTADLLSSASDALSWLEAAPSKPVAIASEVCLFLAPHLLDTHSDECKPLLSRCRELLLSNPPALAELDRTIKDRAVGSR